MSTWVRTDVYIGNRIALLTTTSRQLRSHCGVDISNLLQEVREGDRDSVTLLEKVVTDIIADIRPDLANGLLSRIYLDVRTDKWYFCYTHPSFEAHPLDGTMLPEISLVREG